MYFLAKKQKVTANVVVGLPGNESSDLNRFTLVTPKSENDVRLQATLVNQNLMGLPVGEISISTMNKETAKKIINKLSREYPNAGCSLSHDNIFQLLVSTMLSAQTTDKRVNIVTPALYKAYPDPYSMSKATPEEIMPYIKSIGLYKNKSKNAVAMAKKLCEDFQGIVPNNLKDLTSLPGVGRKTANVVLADGFGEQHIAVDTHVFRVSNRIGLVHEDNVLKTEKALMEVIPSDSWTKSHHLLIFHGRNCCNARKPNCENCCIKDYCEHNGRK